MSNFLAIATATATLSQLLQDAAGEAVTGATVTTRRPEAPNGAEEAHVNLYLYQVTPNAAWRNADLPTRRSDGGLSQRPQAALDLHYLLSFFGDELQLVPQRLLGGVVRTLHARSVLTREMIRKAIDTLVSADPTHFLQHSDLAEQVELIKFSPIPLNLEELSKLWSVFFQTPYTLSVAYQGTVVLIESEEMPHKALPVRKRKLYVLPFNHPVIERLLNAEVEEDAGADPRITMASILVIQGRQLRGQITHVRIGSVLAPPPPLTITDTRISLPLASLTALRAGVQSVQVVHDIPMGEPEVPHRGVESNVAAFVLSPTITPTISAISSVVENGIALFSATVTVTFAPSVGRTQRLRLLLNEFNAPNTRPPRDYSFTAPKDNGITNPNQADTASVAFSISRVLAGEYLVRAQVDGADSVLRMNLAVSPPVFEPGQTVIIS
jgi:hypothetical protein